MLLSVWCADVGGMAALGGWQKRGIGLYYSAYEKTGYNPVKNQEEQAVRNKLITELELKTGAEYQEWVISLLQKI